METPACNIAEDLKDLAQSHGMRTWEADQESDLSLYPSSDDVPAVFFLTTGGELFQVSVSLIRDPSLRGLFLEPPGPSNV